MKKQRSYTSEYKFKVAIEMVKGDLTIAEIISKYQVPRSVLSRWKRELLENGSEIFKKGNQMGRSTGDSELERLHAVIGRLKVENDFLQQASAKLL